MSTKSKDTQGESYDPVPAGTQHGICIAVIDIGTQPSSNPQFKPRPKVIITWELPNEKITVTKDGSSMELNRVISATYTNTLASKGNLRPDLASWRGRDFTEAELESFELGALIGANCLLSVVHNKKDTKTYANVASISPLMKGMPKLKPDNPTVHFDLDVFLASDAKELPDTLHNWIKDKIVQSAEWQRAKSGKSEPTEAQKANQGEADEDVPF